MIILVVELELIALFLTLKLHEKKVIKKLAKALALNNIELLLTHYICVYFGFASVTPEYCLALKSLKNV